MKLEIITLSLGLLGSSVYLTIISIWGEIPTEIRELFRGGNIGAQILGILILSGLIGLPFFLTNLIKSQYKLWWLRSIGFAGFALLTIAVAINV